MNAPVPPASAAGTATVAAAGVRATVVPSAQTRPLAQGDVLHARVVARSPGQLVVSTAAGTITLQANSAPAVGAAVLLRVLSGGERPQLLLSPQPTPGAAAAGNSAGITAGNNPGAGSVITQGSLISATVTPNSAPAAPGQSAAPPSHGGTTSPQGGNTSPQGGNAPPASAAASVTLRVLGVAPPGAVTPPTAPPGAHASAASGGSVLTATVTGYTPDGFPTAQSNAGRLTIATASTIPVGSRLLLELLPAETPQHAVPGDGLPVDRLAALREAVAALRGGDAVLANTLAQSAMPQLGPRLGAGMLFFLSAVFSGDLRRVFNDDALRALTRGGGELAQRLGAELGQSQQAATDAAGQPWRVYSIPLLHGEALEQIRLLIRERDEDERESADERGVRFLVEVSLSRLGAFQFDGLARRKQLDLAVRTERPLPADMRREISRIFTNSVSAMDLTGTVLFQTTPTIDSPVITPDTNAKSGLLV